MLSLLLAATLNIGVYHAFSAEVESVTIHNRAGESRAETKIEKIGIKKLVNDLLKRAQDEINQKVFYGKAAVEIKAVFVEYLSANLPTYPYSENGKQIINAVDIMKVWPMVRALKHPAKADIYLILINSEMTSFSEIRGKMTLLDGRANDMRGDQIALATFMNSYANDMEILLLHEIGHIFGLLHQPENLEHPEKNICDYQKRIMCPNWPYKKEAVFDESYKKAWRDFYYQKTGQKF